MRHASFRSAIVLCSALLLPAAAALANGGGSMGGSGGSMGGGSFETSVRTPEQRAKDAYNGGVRVVKKADEASADAKAATDPKKQQKYAEKAEKLYREARDKFLEAIVADGSMYQAWNYIGYSRRNLGDYPGALQAYDRALSLNPGYADAIEYRGVAYLGMNRVSDAKEAYLSLFASNRQLADKLLAAMRDWSAKAEAGGSVDATQLTEFKAWVDERSKIASTTAGLSPEGAAAHWN
jgi:tetratricopeptide (TPR) repeat protein